jgi:hypothetical protein
MICAQLLSEKSRVDAQLLGSANECQRSRGFWTKKWGDDFLCEESSSEIFWQGDRAYKKLRWLIRYLELSRSMAIIGIMPSLNNG